MFPALLAALTLSGPPASPVPDSVYAPLRLYQGDWQSQSKGSVDRLHNDCALIGEFFGCQQTVNGKVTALILFMPADMPGHYYTQSVQREGGAAGGRGILEIDGNHWLYSSSFEENGKRTYYRTINDFTGTDKIHFEQGTSPDGKTWTITNSGDEQRVRAVK